MRYRAFLGAFCAFCLAAVTWLGGSALAVPKGLSYDDVVNTGLANKCPEVSQSVRGSIPLEPGKSYQLSSLCIEPTEYFVKQAPTSKRAEAKFVEGKALTRYTSSLDEVFGDLQPNSDGTLTFVEQGGIDFQAITVLLPAGEEYPFMFTVKSLKAKTSEPTTSINTSTTFEGNYRVPSYRTSNFLDPKARGLTTGYDSAVAIPSMADDESIAKENVKKFVSGDGTMALLIDRVDSSTGEVGGIFEAVQPSDTDMGGKAAVDVKIRGVFYGIVDEA
jgi:photosystem II oxygen-evolving enhancer protein 1